MPADPKCSVCDTRLPAKGMLRWGLRWVCHNCTDIVRDNQRKSDAEARDRARVRHERSVNRRAARRVPSSSIKLKRQVRKRDGNRCRWCGITKDLEVHHVLYRSQQGPDHHSNLVTLCTTCHMRAHGNKRHWQPVLLGLIWLHYAEGRYMTVPEAERRLQRAGLIPLRSEGLSA